MIVYRLARKKHPDYLNGRGAALYGARWNSAGTELIYTAQNRSLAMAEVAVHLTLATLPNDYLMISIFIPDEIQMKEVPLDVLPEDWNSFPHPTSTQRIGDEFVRANEFCLLRVPSAVTKGDFNILINPKHVDFQYIGIRLVEDFPFDYRIFK